MPTLGPTLIKRLSFSGFTAVPSSGSGRPSFIEKELSFRVVRHQLYVLLSPLLGVVVIKQGSLAMLLTVVWAPCSPASWAYPVYHLDDLS